MKLHEAIEFVLKKNGRSMYAREIADEINDGSLYQRNDGNPVPASQIHARVNKYLTLFSKEFDGRISRLKNALTDLISIARGMQNIINNSRPFFGVSINRKHLLVPAFFFFKRIIDNPSLSEKYLGLRNSGIQFGFNGFISFLKELNYKQKCFRGKLGGLISDAESIPQLISEEPFLKNFKEISLSEENISTTEFGFFFNELIYTVGKQNLKTGEFYSPNVLGVLMNGLLPEIKSQSTKIYNPAAGFATIPAILSQQSESSFSFFGEEINTDVFLLGAMNLIVNNINTDNFHNADSFLSKHHESEFDFVFCVPPFVGKYQNKEVQGVFPVETTDLNLLFLQKCVLSLKNEGKAILLVPDGFLQSQNKEQLGVRHYLYKYNLIEGVISLPADLLYPLAAVKTSLLVLSKRQNETLTFVDAEGVHLSSKFNNQVNNKAVTEICNKFLVSTLQFFTDIVAESFVDYGRVRNIQKSYKDIRDDELNLSVKRNMVFDSAINDSTEPLSAVLERYEGQNIKVSGKLPFVNIRDLNDDPLKVYLDEAQLAHTSDLRKGRILNVPSLLISSISPNAKPTFYKPQRQPILVSQNIHIFKVKTDKVDLEYLISQLSTDEFRNQMDAFSFGSTLLKRISINDVLSLRIKLPTTEQQKEIIRIQKEGVYLRKIHEAKEFARKSGITGKSEKEILGFVKHEIGNISGGIRNDIKNLKSFLTRKGIDFKDKVSGSQNAATLQRVFERMEVNVNDIENLMTNIKGIIELADHPINKTQVDFAQFVKSECERTGLIKEKGIKLYLRTNDYSLPMINEMLVIDKDQFGVVVRNFVINAVKHGFNKDEAKEKIIVFNLEEDDDYFYIHMINNGDPFPEELTLEDFLKFGGRQNIEKGSGMGGFLIGKVIENHGGTIELIPVEKTIYIEDELVELEIKPSIALNAGVHFLIKLPKE